MRKGAVHARLAGRATAAKTREDSDRQTRVIWLIRNLPRGKVASYGAIAKAAGWPGAARQVVRILRAVDGLPWHRVVGAGGAIKLPGEGGAEQRFRLRMEGVAFRGSRVDMRRHEFRFAKENRSPAKRRIPASRKPRS